MTDVELLPFECDACGWSVWLDAETGAAMLAEHRLEDHGTLTERQWVEPPGAAEVEVPPLPLVYLPRPAGWMATSQGILLEVLRMLVDEEIVSEEAAIRRYLGACETMGWRA